MTWQITTHCNPSSRGSNALLWPLWALAHMNSWKYMHISIKKLQRDKSYLWSLDTRTMVTELEQSPSHLFLKEPIGNQYDLFLKCLVQFTTESIWKWCFLFWKDIDYWFIYITDKHQSVYIAHSFFRELAIGCIFLDIGPFHLCHQIYRHRIFQSIPKLADIQWHVRLFPRQSK